MSGLGRTQQAPRRQTTQRAERRTTKAETKVQAKGQQARRTGYSDRSTFEPSGGGRTSKTSAITRTATVTAMTEEQKANVRMMAEKAKAAGVPPELPVMTALVENRLKNENRGHGSSVGLFQQHTDWGTEKERMDPKIATDKFLKGGTGNGTPGAADKRYMTEFNNPKAGETEKEKADRLGKWAQKVQRSDFPDRYRDEYQNARAKLKEAGVPGY